MIQAVDTGLFYAILVTAISLGLLLVGVVVSYLSLVKKYTAAKESEKKLREDLEKRISQRIDEANIQSQKIIEAANLKAQQVVSDAQLRSKTQTDAIEKYAQEILERQIGEYKTMIASIQDKTIKAIQNIPEDIKSTSKSQIESITNSMKSEIDQAEKEIKLNLESLVKNAEVEVNEYKKARMDQIDTSIIEIVHILAKKIFGKSVALKDQEKLILESLEKAKKQGMLN